MSQEQRQIDSIFAWEIKQKLEVVLKNLNQQYEEMKGFYHKKISQLYEEIVEKDSNIEKLEKRVEEGEKKIIDLEWKLVEKGATVEKLNMKVKVIKQNFKRQMSTYIDQINLSSFDAKSHEDSSKSTDSQYKINISDYFLNTIEKQKGNLSTTNQIFSSNQTIKQFLTVDQTKTCSNSAIDFESPSNSKANLFHAKSSDKIKLHKDKQSERRIRAEDIFRKHKQHEMNTITKKTFYDNLSPRTKYDARWKKINPFYNQL